MPDSSAYRVCSGSCSDNTRNDGTTPRNRFMSATACPQERRQTTEQQLKDLQMQLHLMSVNKVKRG